MIKEYYYLTKPGIIYGNLITTAAGFFLAASGSIDWLKFFMTMIGISLVIACGCVINNFLDRKIDARMERTKNRSLVIGSIPPRNALIFATLLGIAGIIVLYVFTNFLALAVAVVGIFIYVAIYSPMKRGSMHATVVGSIAGAVPPVVGYCAVTSRFDPGAFLLLAVLVFWQMPHFYSIAIYRQDEYKAASVPVLPLVKGIFFTKIQILLYILMFTIASVLLTIYGLGDYAYLAIVLPLGLVWFLYALSGFWVVDDKLWARKSFFISLIVLTGFSLLLSIGSILKNHI